MRHRRRGDRAAPPKVGTPVERQPGSRDEAARPAGAGNGRRPEPLVGPTAERARAKATAKARAKAAEPEKPRRSRSARHPLVVGLSFVFLIALFGLVGGIGALVYGQRAFYAPGPAEETLQVDIPRGSSLQTIAEALERLDIISNQHVFVAAVLARRASGDIKAGEYVVEAHASMAEILDKLISGEVMQHQVTFAEGLTSAQIVKRLNEMDLLSGTIRQIPPEGSLLPETYSVTRGTSRESLITRMRDARDAAVAEVWESRDPDLPLKTPEELVTLASIVEKETGVAPERERVAAVFVNRLNRGMKLQSDPTILYGLYGGAAWQQSRTIYKSDLNRPNPYNTYQIAALPPGPIANPGLAALKATANPAETDELYFVADGTGGHAFATSYEAHQRNVARWREIERQQSGAGNGQSTTQ